MPASKLTTAFEAALSADEVEEACLNGILASAEAGLLDERISGETTDDPVGISEARWSRDTQLIDDATGAVAEELERRANMPGGGYPFKFDGKSLRYITSQSLAYEFCLAASRAETIVEGKFVRLVRNFERLSAITARLYLGEGAEGVRIGAPTDDEDPAKHPRSFAGRAALLNAIAPVGSDEWKLSPLHGFEEAVEDAKDFGMDFVAWKSFPDERIGRIMLLGQCACGRNDQADDEKLKELDLRTLGNIFRPLPWLEPQKLFATPFHVAEPSRFKAMHRLGSMIFDRLRIAALCERNWSDLGLKELRPRLESLIEMVVGNIKLGSVAVPRRRAGRSKRT